MAIKGFTGEVVVDFLYCDNCNTKMVFDRYIIEGEKENMKMNRVYICKVCGKVELHDDDFPRVKILVGDKIIKYL